jgi:hypothetical protein
MHDTSEILLRGMQTTLDTWASKLDSAPQHLYWVLRLQMAEHGFDGWLSVAGATEQIPESIRQDVLTRFRQANEYWNDVRYASLEPVTQLWGTIVNAIRVAANSDRATEVQKQVFVFPEDSLVAFFRAARERMEVAEELHNAFKAMPAPECQALGALLNVHVEGRLDADILGRLVRLLDHEGPMSAEEQQALSALSATKLVDAAFSGVRSHA